MQQPDSSSTLMTCILVVRRSGDRIPVGSEIFRIHPDSSSFLHKGYCVSYIGIKRPGRGVDHPPPQRPRLKGDSTPLFPFSAFMACYMVNFTLSDSNSWREHILSWLGEMGLSFSQENHGTVPPFWTMTGPSVFFSNSLLTYHPTIRCYKNCTAETVEIHGDLKGLCKLQDFPTQ
jgi:hypothetical protein